MSAFLTRCSGFVQNVRKHEKRSPRLRKLKSLQVDMPADESYGTKFPPARDSRRCGILLHPTSLPGPYLTGDLGPEAYAFIDWLESAKMQVWQVLPLVPPGRPIPGIRDDFWSPYSGRDAHCGNTLMISLDLLVNDGLLSSTDLPTSSIQSNHNNNFQIASEAIEPLLHKAARNMLNRNSSDKLRLEYEVFCGRSDTKLWLKDAALFDVIENIPELRGIDWWDWPVALRDREESELLRVSEKYSEQLDEFCAIQFFWHRQWLSLKKYANSKGISIIGDMPIYMGGHSADVWAHPHLFQLGPDRRPEMVAGTPPDAFSDVGQLWGNPLYSWRFHKKEKYAWWCSRIRRALELHDEIRIDHFRAFSAYWAVQAGEKTAKNGKWYKGPGIEFFDGIKSAIGDSTIIAEDLGVITADVTELRESISAPGMVILQFAWGSDGKNPHLPHNHYENSVCYTGTHDNETSKGWYLNQSESVQEKLKNYAHVTPCNCAWDLIGCAMASVSKTCVVPMQDVLSLGNEARMNTPGVADGNWTWRLGAPQVFSSLTPEATKLAQMVTLYDRAQDSRDS